MGVLQRIKEGVAIIDWNTISFYLALLISISVIIMDIFFVLFYPDFYNSYAGDI